MIKKLGLFVLLVIAVLIFNYQRDDDGAQITPNALTTDEEADYFAKNLVRQLYDKTGKHTQQLKAKQAHHYEQKKILVLDSPNLKSESQQTPWEIQARMGILHNDSSKVELKKQVVITQLANQKTQQGQLTTEYMLYYPKEQVGETQEDIKVTYPNLTIWSTGMRAELKQQIIYFKQGVTSRYEPNP